MKEEGAVTPPCLVLPHFAAILLCMAIKHARQIKIGNKHKFVARKSTVGRSFSYHMHHAPSWDQVLKSKFVVDSIVIKPSKRTERVRDRESKGHQMTVTPALFLSPNHSLYSHKTLNNLYRPTFWCLSLFILALPVFTCRGHQSTIPADIFIP